MPGAKLTILTALREELNAVNAAIPKGTAALHVVRGGIGPDSAAKAIAEILGGEKPQIVCSSGFCGGVADGVAVGDLVLATAIVEGDGKKRERIDVKPEILSKVSEALKSAGIAFHSGLLVSVREPVLQTTAKRALGSSNSALAVDMESYTLAEACRRAGTDFFALRVVSDAVDDELPPEIGEFLDSQGNVRTTVIARFALGGPSNMKKLWALKGRSDKAGKALTAAWKACSTIC